MASASITPRSGKTGRRFVVRYRLGGRAYPIVHGGSFHTMKEARTRLDLIRGELAAGRNPTDLLRHAETPQVRTFEQWAEAYQASRVDYADETTKNLGSHLKAFRVFNDRDPAMITFGDIQEWVAGLTLKPSSIRRYVATLRLLLDFAGVDPNPARDKRVKLPSVVTEEPNPPTATQFLTILDKSPSRWRLPFVLMEQTAMRVGEIQSLAWGDVDVLGCQFLLRAGETKTRRPRWVQVPGWLMDELDKSCPLEDRTAERSVFLGFTADVAKNVIARACVAARIPHFHPHDLRHRRLSLWHGQGVPAKELAGRAGHSRASMTLDVYSHVLIDKTEATSDELLSRCAA